MSTSTTTAAASEAVGGASRNYNNIYAEQVSNVYTNSMDSQQSQQQQQRNRNNNSGSGGGGGLTRTPPSSPPRIYPNTSPATSEAGQIMVSNFVALPPPSYEDAIIDQRHDPAASVPPPSYDSLYGRVREAQKQSKGALDFVKNIFILLLGTIGFSIILGITIVIPVCMIAFGSYYLHRCPQGEFIPIYLLIGGIMGVLKPLLSLSTHVRRSAEDQAIEQMRQSGTQRLINWFMLGWFMIGSYWIYRIYEPNYNPALGRYCNENLYKFAFWLVTSVYILLGLSVMCLSIITLLSVILYRKSVENSNNNV